MKKPCLMFIKFNTVVWRKVVERHIVSNFISRNCLKLLFREKKLLKLVFNCNCNNFLYLISSVITSFFNNYLTKPSKLSDQDLTIHLFVLSNERFSMIKKTIICSNFLFCYSRVYGLWSKVCDLKKMINLELTFP